MFLFFVDFETALLIWLELLGNQAGTMAGKFGEKSRLKVQFGYHVYLSGNKSQGINPAT